MTVAATILTFRDGVFEPPYSNEGFPTSIARRLSCGSSERRAFGHSPGSEDTIELKAQLVMKLLGVMVLNNKPHAVRRFEAPLGSLVFGTLDRTIEGARRLSRFSSNQRPETRIAPSLPNVRWTAEIMLDAISADTSISPSNGASLRAPPA